MTKNENINTYKRKVTGAERFFSHSPFSIVTMVVRIKGHVDESMLKAAVEKAQQQHALRRTRICDPQNGELWFTTDGAQEIPIEVVSRSSKDDWIEIHAAKAKIPYEFEKRPPIRFVLVQSEDVSELIIFCHHMICDGMSLAYLARDLMTFLGDPKAEVNVLPDPEPISLDNLPSDVAPSSLIKYFINKIRQKWADEIVFFNQEDYEALNEVYWDNYQHKILSIDLSEAETASLVARCRKEKVTVNTALITAFSGA